MWVLCSVFELIYVLDYIGLLTSLDHNAESRMNAYNDAVKMVPRAANLKITLPRWICSH